MSEDRSKQECIDPEIGAFLVSYALGTLTASDEEKFELHLLQCEACRAEIAKATPALETLSATRDQFVQRAKQEEEDFESQFGKLRQQKQRTARGGFVKIWAESLGEALWTRKWMVATVGVAAVAFLFLLRKGPESVAPPIYPELRSPSAPLLMKLPPSGQDSSAAPREPSVVKEEKMLTAPQTHSMTKLRATEEVTSAPKLKSPKGTKEPVPSVIGVMPEQAEIMRDMPESTGRSDVSTLLTKQPGFKVSDSHLDNSDLRQLADDALGKFDSTRYSEPPRGNHEEESVNPNELSAMAFNAPARDTLNADTIPKGEQIAKMRNAFQQGLAEDSSNPNLQFRFGIEALERLDYEHARAAFGMAYKAYPPGEQRDEATLLLARVAILEGKTSVAKSQLQTLAAATLDSSRKALAQQAIAKIDSFMQASAPVPVPK